MLFDFVHRLCLDAGSPIPGRVHLTHDVNAAVTYPRSLFSLIWPVRKNLLIGLGLVNSLNLSEFKAVLAHEFGHFSQSSMKLGQYVYVANQVIADMVFQRDFWDGLILKWRSIDIRLSFPAWALSLVVWVLRHFLGLIFRLINLLNLSLSRQMEFNADLHAVRLTGSDALISGLWKVERGSLAYQLAASDLASLAEHRRYSDDLYHHQEKSLERLEEVLGKDPRAREHYAHLLRSYEPGRKIHFPVSEESASAMWATHPSNRQREKNVKKTYVPHPEDDRSAWRIFHKTRELRTALTVNGYRDLVDLKPGRRELSPAAAIHELILEEREEMRQAEHYHGFYDDRQILPGDPEALAREVDEGLMDGTLSPGALRREARVWNSARLKEAMEKLTALQEEMNLLRGLKNGVLEVRGDTFEFRARDVDLGSLDDLLERTGKEQEDHYNDLKEADRIFFRHFYHLSGREETGGEETRLELLQRYEFLVAVQKLVVRLGEIESRTGPVLDYLQQGKKLSEEDFLYVRNTFQDGHSALEQVVHQCDGLLLPRLSHLREASSVKSFVLEERLLEPPPGKSIDGEWIQLYLKQFQQVVGRLRKLHFKNLGLLLKLEERLDPGLFGEPSEETPARAEPEVHEEPAT